MAIIYIPPQCDCDGSSSSGSSSVGISSEDVLEMFVEMDLMQPVVDENNKLFIDDEGRIFIL